MSLAKNVLENLRLELRRGCLTVAVLAQLRQEHFGYSLREALAQHKLDIDVNTLLSAVAATGTPGAAGEPVA